MPVYFAVALCPLQEAHEGHATTNKFRPSRRHVVHFRAQRFAGVTSNTEASAAWRTAGYCEHVNCKGVSEQSACKRAVLALMWVKVIARLVAGLGVPSEVLACLVAAAVGSALYLRAPLMHAARVVRPQMPDWLPDYGNGTCVPH